LENVAQLFVSYKFWVLFGLVSTCLAFIMNVQS